MEKSVEITRASLQDVPAIMSIMDTAFALVPDKSWYCTDNEDFVKRHIEENGFILKAVVEGETAGFLVVRFPRGDSDNLGSYAQLDEAERQLVAHMESAAVDPRFRGMGIQKKLMAQGEEYLKKIGYRYLMGTAHPQNKFSVSNFKKLDYEILAEDIKYGGYPRYIFLKHV